MQQEPEKPKVEEVEEYLSQKGLHAVCKHKLLCVLREFDFDLFHLSGAFLELLACALCKTAGGRGG